MNNPALSDPAIIRNVIVKEIKQDPNLGLITICDGIAPLKGRLPNELIMARMDGAKSLVAYTLFLFGKFPFNLFSLIPSYRFKVLNKLSDIFHKNLHPSFLPLDGMSRSGVELSRAFDFKPECVCKCHDGLMELKGAPTPPDFLYLVLEPNKAGSLDTSMMNYQVMLRKHSPFPPQFIDKQSVFLPRTHCLECKMDTGLEIIRHFKLSFLSFYEFDDAYRFRLQDILPNLDKSRLLVKPRKELCRLMDLAISRERSTELNKKYSMAKWIIRIMPRKYLKELVKMLLNIDMTKIRLDADDMEWAQYKKYDFNGVPWINPKTVEQKNK